jgi:hypothetical protein
MKNSMKETLVLTSGQDLQAGHPMGKWVVIQAGPWLATNLALLIFSAMSSGENLTPVTWA